MPRDISQRRIGRSDQGPPGVHVAGPHPPRTLRERLDIPLGQAAAHVPEQHAIPVRREDRQRFGIAHIHVGQLRWRADHPEAGLPRLREQIARSGRRQPHAVEAQRCEPFERLAVVVDRPREKRHAPHLEHAAGEAGGRILRRGRHRWLWHCGWRRRELGGPHVGIADGRRRCRGGRRRDDPLDEHVVDRHVIAAWRRIELEHEMRDRRVREVALRPVFGPQRQELSLQARRQSADVEPLPALGILGDAAGHEHLDGLAGLGGDEVGEHHAGGEPDVGPVGPHPERCLPFVDHPRRLDRHLHAQRRAGGGVDDKPLTGRAAMGSLAGAGMAHHAVAHVRFRHLPGWLRTLERVFEGGGGRPDGGPCHNRRTSGQGPWQAARAAVTSFGHRWTVPGAIGARAVNMGF